MGGSYLSKHNGRTKMGIQVETILSSHTDGTEMGIWVEATLVNTMMALR